MNLLFLGDSLIEFFDWGRRFPEHRVVNSGLAGETVEGLLSRLQAMKGALPEADKIFIMTGINNIAMDDTGFIASYRKVTGKLSFLYPAALIYINSLLPALTGFINNSAVREANILLKKLALETGTEFLDIYSCFVENGVAVPDYLLEDGVHLSGKGYEVWSGEIEKALFPAI